jgi:acyl-[acyl-carrier-protein] desaturase
MVGLDAQATKFVESRDRMRARMQARSDEKLAPLPT